MIWIFDYKDQNSTFFFLICGHFSFLLEVLNYEVRQFQVNPQMVLFGLLFLKSKRIRLPHTSKPIKTLKFKITSIDFRLNEFKTFKKAKISANQQKENYHSTSKKACLGYFARWVPWSKLNDANCQWTVKKIVDFKIQMLYKLIFAEIKERP